MVVGSLSIETELLIIGAGPGGYVAAIRAAQLGKEVMVVDEHGEHGGVCLHHGCIPTKTLIHSTNFGHVINELEHCGVTVDNHSVDFTKVQANKDHVVENLNNGIKHLFKKHGVEMIKGRAEFKDEHTVHLSGQSDVEKITFKECIIATGSTPVELDAFPFSEERILTSRDLIHIDHIPESLIVIGGGYIGTEMSTVFGKLGTDITLLEATDRLIHVVPEHVVEVVAKKLPSFGVDIHTESQAKTYDATDENITVQWEENGETREETAELCVVVVGRKPNTAPLHAENAGIELDNHGFIPVNAGLRTPKNHIAAIGDVTGQPLLAHKAIRQGRIAAENLSGKHTEYNNMVIPSVVFNDPEIACVGFTAEEAAEEGIDTVTGRFPFSASGRAQTLSQPEGFVEVTAEKDTQRVIGVHSVGPQVSGMIGEATLAIENGLTLRDVADTIHTHPTIPEALMEACQAALNEAIHTSNK